MQSERNKQQNILLSFLRLLWNIFMLLEPPQLSVCDASLLFFYLLSLLETERVITLLHAGQRGSVVGTSRDSMQGHEEKVTKYGHVCRGGREENKLQLVNVHTRASTEEQTAGGKREEEDTEEEGARRCEPKWAHGFSAFRRHGYRAHRHPHGENEIWPGAKNHNGMRDTDPPLLILLPIHHDHLALGEGQLVWVVGNTVVDGFHSLRPLLLGKTHTNTFFYQVYAEGKYK